MLAAIRDPIHGTITIDPWAVPLVEAPVFQRLRRVQQLGTAHLVYPGAHHKRFEHSLGAHHLAGCLAQTLKLDADAARTVRAAALLHDVGHGPFSHAFEELLKEQGRRHEETTVDLVRWGPLADLLRQGGLDPVAIGEAVLGRGPVAPLVSGAIDADRMDYLLRDAHYTGVRSSVDVDRLTQVLDYDAEHGLVIQESGILAAEAFLTMRFLMYPAVYLHHTVRASEAMLLAAIRAHVADGHAELKDLERETDDGLMGRIRREGGVAADFAQRLDERRLYKRAYEGRDSDSDVLRRLRKDPKARATFATEVAQAADVPIHHVLVDVPHPPRFREAGAQVKTSDGTLHPLADASRLVRVLGDARMDHWRWWVFAPKADRDRVAAAAQRILGEAPATALK